MGNDNQASQDIMIILALLGILTSILAIYFSLKRDQADDQDDDYYIPPVPPDDETEPIGTPVSWPISMGPCLERQLIICLPASTPWPILEGSLEIDIRKTYEGWETPTLHIVGVSTSGALYEFRKFKPSNGVNSVVFAGSSTIKFKEVKVYLTKEFYDFSCYRIYMLTGRFLVLK